MKTTLQQIWFSLWIIITDEKRDGISCVCKVNETPCAGKIMPGTYDYDVDNKIQQCESKCRVDHLNYKDRHHSAH